MQRVEGVEHRLARVYERRVAVVEELHRLDDRGPADLVTAQRRLQRRADLVVHADEGRGPYFRGRDRRRVRLLSEVAVLAGIRGRIRCGAQSARLSAHPRAEGEERIGAERVLNGDGEVVAPPFVDGDALFLKERVEAEAAADDAMRDAMRVFVDDDVGVQRGETLDPGRTAEDEIGAPAVVARRHHPQVLDHRVEHMHAQAVARAAGVRTIGQLEVSLFLAEAEEEEKVVELVAEEEGIDQCLIESERIRGRGETEAVGGGDRLQCLRGVVDQRLDGVADHRRVAHPVVGKDDVLAIRAGGVGEVAEHGRGAARARRPRRAEQHLPGALARGGDDVEVLGTEACRNPHQPAELLPVIVRDDDHVRGDGAAFRAENGRA